jgi:hypothetical protein
VIEASAPLIGLDDLADGGGHDNPIPLMLNNDLANGGWESVLSAIVTADKYVSLDLSACAMDGTEFDPVTAGADKITALVLPDAAKSIQAGIFDNPTFQMALFSRGSPRSTVELKSMARNTFRSFEPLRSSIADSATFIFCPICVSARCSLLRSLKYLINSIDRI